MNLILLKFWWNLENRSGPDPLGTNASYQADLSEYCDEYHLADDWSSHSPEIQVWSDKY